MNYKHHFSGAFYCDLDKVNKSIQTSKYKHVNSFKNFLLCTNNRDFLLNDKNSLLYVYGKNISKVLIESWFNNKQRDIKKLIDVFIEQMFPFTVIYHESNLNRTILFRDRYGELPLYYYIDRNQLIFSSKIADIKEVYLIDPELSIKNIHETLICNFVKANNTVYKNINEVIPGHYIEVVIEDKHIYKKNIKWNLSKISTFEGCEQDAYNIFDKLFNEAVYENLKGIKNFAMLLSGGTDSSAVLASIINNGLKPDFAIHTGFEEKNFSETEYANTIAESFNISLRKIILNSSHVNYYPQIMKLREQPGGDFSFLPFYIMGKTLDFSECSLFCGDGGDELMCGYWYYLDVFNNKLSLQNLYDKFSVFTKEELKQLCNIEYDFNFNVFEGFNNDIENNINILKNFDQNELWPGNNLKKTGKMVGEHGIYVNSPFMYPPLVEFLNSLPYNFHIDKTGGKKILKKWLNDQFKGFNPFFWNRNKQMFTVPIGEWIKRDLFEVFEQVLKMAGSISELKLNSSYIGNLLSEHRSGAKNNTRKLRMLFSLIIWYKLIVDTETIETSMINRLFCGKKT